MANLMPLSPARLRDLIARRSQSLSQSSAPAEKNPLIDFKSSEELESYPAPASFVVQGEICEQLQSPLFGKIPAEIRNEIFALALTEYVPADREWARESYVKRPGYQGLKTVDVGLLRTCKRAYEETKLLPLQDLEVCFYMGDRRRAPDWYTMTSYTSVQTFAHPRLNWFKPEHWARIKHYHVFGQMYALQAGFRGLFRNNDDICQPTTLTLTLRYTDWWYWENNTDIYPINPTHFFPMRDIELPSTVQEVVVEFENVESKVNELEAVVGDMFQQADSWVWTRRDGRKLVLRGNERERDGIKTWRWSGPTLFGERRSRFPHHPEGDSMQYVVKVLTWQLCDEE